MCEFCHSPGRCNVCDHLTHTTRVMDIPHSETGYVVLLNGVRVRYDNRPDALAVLKDFPSARVV